MDSQASGIGGTVVFGREWLGIAGGNGGSCMGEFFAAVGRLHDSQVTVERCGSVFSRSEVYAVAGFLAARASVVSQRLRPAALALIGYPTVGRSIAPSRVKSEFPEFIHITFKISQIEAKVIHEVHLGVSRETPKCISRYPQV
jgi:hypothetical protein